jgi:hypothetical protein
LNFTHQTAPALSPDDIRPLLFASLISGSFAALCLSLLVVIEDSRGWTLSSFATLFVISAVVANLIAFTASLLIGLPTAWILRRFGWERAWAYVVIGTIAGAAIMVWFDYRTKSDLLGRWPGVELADLVLGGAPGGLCAALWWKLTRYRSTEILDG